MLSKSVPAMPRTEAADGSAVIVGVDEPTEQIKRGALFSGRIDTAQQVSNVPRVHDAARKFHESPETVILFITYRRHLVQLSAEHGRLFRMLR